LRALIEAARLFVEDNQSFSVFYQPIRERAAESAIKMRIEITP
jgi:hypothetical protein